jgi:hypothetical protein
LEKLEIAFPDDNGAAAQQLIVAIVGYGDRKVVQTVITDVPLLTILQR